MIELISMLLSLLCGVALFLFGMSLMGDGLKSVAGNKLEAFLYKMTNTPLKGVILGTIVTSVIQSSSATTVMVIGFVNSGMMKLGQAIGILFGSNIGTSITGWILCLSYVQGSSGIASLLSTTTIAALTAIIGIVLRMFSKKTVQKNVGSILLGFSILMLGMQTMSGAVSPLRENEAFIRMLTMFSNPIAGVLVGIAFTAILQSSSATIGILQALSITGMLTFASAFPLILGIGIGASCPVLISAIDANKNGKRTALIYLLNDVIGLFICSIPFYCIHAIVHFSFMDMTMSPVKIALLNTLIRAVVVIVLYPFIPKLESFVCKLVKDNPDEIEDESDFDLLDERLTKYPALAIGQCQRVINGMAKNVRKNINRSLNLLNHYEKDKFEKVQRKENLIDKYESRLGEYMIRLTRHEMNTLQATQVSLYLHAINDFERIGDHASYLAHISNEMNDNRTVFSDSAKEELNIVMSAVREITNITCAAFMNEDKEEAKKVAPLGSVITSKCDELRMLHVERLREGKCDLEQGTIYTDVLNSFTSISSHCASAMGALLKSGIRNTDIHIHNSKLEPVRPSEYFNYLTEFKNKYDISKAERVLSMEAEEVE